MNTYKTAFLVSLLTFCASLGFGQGCDIKLTNGFTMRQCRVLAWGGDTVTISYVGGTVPVKVTNVAPESLSVLEGAKQKASRDAVAYRTSTPAVTSQDSAAGEDKASEIRDAVLHRSPVVGMNQSQVVEAMGGNPSDKSKIVTGDGNVVERWIYARRGVPHNGIIGDRWLDFVNGILTNAGR